jgi:hypothetical protein
VSPHPTFVPHAMIKQTIHDRIQNYALAPEPWSARALRIEPNIEDVARFGFDGAGQSKIDKVHQRFLFPCSSKDASRRSSRSLQNRS